MSKKKNARGIPPLSENAKEEDIIEWTTTHDVFERLDAGIAEVVDERQDLDELLEERLQQELQAHS